MTKKESENQAKQSKPEILQGHEKVGTKYLPPLLTYPSERLSLVSWYHDLLPELLWLALLRDQQGYRVAIESAIQLSDIVNAVMQSEERRSGFCLASDYNTIHEHERDEVTSKIGTKLRNTLVSCVGLITKFYPEFPMGWLVSEKWMRETSVGLDGVEQIKNAVGSRIDRTSKSAMECQVLAFVMEGKCGKIKFPPGSVPDLNLISKYPESDESREMAATVRASIKAVLMIPERKGTWVNYFWRHSHVISACEYPSVSLSKEMLSPVDIKKILERGQLFHDEGKKEVKNLWSKAKIDLANSTRYDVTAGLLARNLQFACDVTGNPSLWVMPIAAILLRCMIETQIRLAWLIKCGSDKDFKDYVEFGLGQEKLLVEHYKRLSKEGRPDRQRILDEIEDREMWINAQKWEFLLAVDVGGGSQGKDLRTMADEAGILDLHRLAFSPFSSAVHGHWNTIARLNLIPCSNPLHGQHWLPILSSRPVSPSCVLDAVSCYAECYEMVHLELAGEKGESEAVLSYREGMQGIFESSSDGNGREVRNDE